ncbi:uncharacterized protein DSM5745_02627 [Aspergillus mulundensis]|uniref:Uncharacterized protein n=1 Tax=Aspergillus mulundensis TaxID=1810919 RepID=A0A3D8SX07_9EURO|nr:hypothetical protein DSM5745_02627 [Aspergillus mulundensis]RDW90852.1 hypothetical protein DSM5745_02627 [Aspergillus mulundensis]
MSTNPSIIFYQGLRCTKIRRAPAATDSATSPIDTPSNTSIDAPSPTETLAEDGNLSKTSPDQSSTERTSAVASASATSIPDFGTAFSNHTSSRDSDYLSDLNTIHSTLSTSSTHTTFATETSTQPTSSTSSTSSVSDDDSGPPYALLFGILFGILGLITLIALIVLLIYRRRARQESDADSLQDDRASANSRTGLRRDFRSQMSYLDDASPTASAFLNFQAGAAYRPDEQHHQSLRYSNPFSDMAAVADEDVSTTFYSENRTPALPPESYTTERHSYHSETSLGSTIVLPGRSSMGSEYSRTQSSARPPGSGTSQGSTLVLPGRGSIGSDDLVPNFSFAKPPVYTSSYTYSKTTVRVNGRGSSFDLDDSLAMVSRSF